MLEHTRKHHIDKRSSFSEQSTKTVTKESVNWRTAAKEAFGDLPKAALNLQGLRAREGVTQAQLGESIHVEQSNISKMERGIRPIGLKIAKRIEEVFDIDYRLFL